MNILVTGGAGYIGSTLVPMLLDAGHRVTVYDNLLHRNSLDAMLPLFRHQCFRFIRGDICDALALKRAMDGIDLVIHLAAIVGFPACKSQPAMAVATNVEGTRMVNRFRGNRPVIFASTGSVYGKLEDMCSEDSSPNPLTLYGETKLAAERIFQKHGNAVIFRFATAFGLSPRMRLDLMPNDFTYHAAVDRFLKIYQPDARRTFLHVHDIARAMLHAVDHFADMRKMVFNCGSNALNCTKRGLVELIQNVVSTTDNPVQADFSANGHDPDGRDYEVEYARLAATGFSPVVSLEQGIREMAAAFEVFRVANPYTSLVGA